MAVGHDTSCAVIPTHCAQVAEVKRLSAEAVLATDQRNYQQVGAVQKMCLHNAHQSDFV